MKKTVTILLTLLLIAGQLFSDPIDKQEAKQLAERFFSAYAPNSKTDNSIDQIIVEKYEGVESFYIYGFTNGGFVIVSADDNSQPILGYSFTNPISDQINPNTRFLFDRYKKAISEVKSLKNKDKKIKEQWDQLRSAKFSGNIKAAGPLLTTEWNQSPIYNMYCPLGTPTGCVATAMSQIMNYHEWPANGNGWHKYIPQDNPNFGELYANFEAETYDWVNMPDALTSVNTTAEKEAIATLCYHAGISVNMNYDSDGSGANTNDVMYALTSYFKYDPSTIELVTYSADNATEYLNKIKNEIDNNRPIYYDGYSEDDGGHAWVCDGYDNNDKVHINWGWGGYYNGYFALSNMAPGSYSFSDGNSMIIGIQPGSVDQEILWTKQASGFEKASRGIQYISAVDKRVAWAVAYDGSAGTDNVKEYTRTINGGSTWTSGTINAEGTDGLSASMITAVDENTAWVALFDGTNGGGKIVKTSDGGKTWIHQSTAAFSSPNGFPNVIHFWDENNGWCQGDPNGGYFEMYTTANGGTMWTRVPQGNIPSNQNGEYGTIGYYAVYGDIVWFATNKGRIFKSTDKGLNWVVYQTPISNASFELSFRNESIGIIQKRSDSGNQAYKTTNGGETWALLNSTGDFYTNSFKYVPGTNLLISTGSDFNTPAMGISYSNDDGATFNKYADFYDNFQFLAIGAASEDAIWVGSYNADENNDGMWHYGDVLIDANVKSNKTMYCLGDDAVFSVDTFGTPETITWNFGDGADPATATGSGPHTVSYSNVGLKDITLTITKGTDEYSIISNDFITYSTAIPANASAITGDAVVKGGETHTYSVTNQDNVSFIWNIPSIWSGESNTNEIDVTFEAKGTETITVTPRNGCGDGALASLEILAEPGTGINNPENSMFNIYPNPAVEYFMISGIESSDIHMYDASGRMVKSIHNYQENQMISTDDLKSGIYYIQVLVHNQSFTKSINILK